jgi:hypothetical protein
MAHFADDNSSSTTSISRNQTPPLEEEELGTSEGSEIDEFSSLAGEAAAAAAPVAATAESDKKTVPQGTETDDQTSRRISALEELVKEMPKRRRAAAKPRAPSTARRGRRHAGASRSRSPHAKESKKDRDISYHSTAILAALGRTGATRGRRSRK